MITIKLIRDQARMIDKTFLPYMVSLAVTKVHDAAETFGAKLAPFRDKDYINCKIVLSLIFDVQKLFRRRLATDVKNFTFKLSDAHAIALYHFLMNHPIDESQVYAHLLRQQLCDHIYKQLLEPVLQQEDEEDWAIDEPNF